jgi:hypothetical protein
VGAVAARPAGGFAMADVALPVRVGAGVEVQSAKADFVLFQRRVSNPSI